MKRGMLALVPLIALGGFWILADHWSERTARRQVSDTMAIMRTLAAALDAYVVDHGSFPVPETRASVVEENYRSRKYTGKGNEGYPPPAWPVARSARWLEPLLSPAYVAELKLKDAWGHDLLYEATADGRFCTIVSHGRDGASDPKVVDNWNAREADHDLVYAYGTFISAPSGWTH